MNIAFVNNQAQLGGAETVARQLRGHATRSGHATRFYVAQGKTYPADVTPLYPRWLSWLSHTRLHSLVERLFPRRFWTDRRFRSLAGTDADLVHVHNFHGDYATVESLAHLVRRKPLVWTFHAGWGITGGCDHPGACRRYLDQCGACPQVGRWPVGGEDQTREQLQRKRRYLSGMPLHVVAPSRQLAQLIRHSPVGRDWQVHHIPNGVNPNQFDFRRKRDPGFRLHLGLPPTVPVILIVNRNFRDPQKGFPIIREALTATVKAGQYIVLAGQGSAWAAAQLPTNIPVLDAGYVRSRERLAEWFEVADIFLFASAAETFPCVILEAMSAKCCVVATSTGGVREQIQSRTTGLLAEEFNTVSLARMLREAVQSPVLRRACGESARRKIETEFSEERMGDAYLRLYDEACGAQLATPEPATCLAA